MKKYAIGIDYETLSVRVLLVNFSTVFMRTRKDSVVMNKVRGQIHKPIDENVKLYNKLYEKYDRLFGFFVKENDVMKRLNKIA